MKRFINGFINILINIFVIILLLVICLIAFIVLISKTNNIAIEDTISYVKSFSEEITGINFTNKDLVTVGSNDFSYESNINISSTNNKFYYNQLDDNSKLIYNSLESNIDNLKKANFKIDFSTKFNKLLNESDGQYILNRSFQTAIDAFFYDHPELFYIDLTKISLVMQYISIGPKTTYTVSIEPKDGNNYLSNGFYSEQNVNKAISKVESIRNNIISNLPSGNDYTKALKVHDILVKSLEYDSTTNRKNSHNIYGALTENTVVCEGYAKAFKYILDSIDIECILVSGTATNSSGKTESHMWNYINLDGNWYGIDVTWDDPIIVGSSITKNIIRHDYFCKGSSIFDDDHVISNKISNEGNSFSLPTLSSRNYK